MGNPTHSGYDMIIIDVPFNQADLLANALCASHKCIVVAAPDPYSCFPTIATKLEELADADLTTKKSPDYVVFNKFCKQTSTQLKNSQDDLKALEDTLRGEGHTTKFLGRHGVFTFNQATDKGARVGMPFVLADLSETEDQLRQEIERKGGHPHPDEDRDTDASFTKLRKHREYNKTALRLEFEACATNLVEDWIELQ